jgi:hypothetical protein
MAKNAKAAGSQLRKGQHRGPAADAHTSDVMAYSCRRPMLTRCIQLSDALNPSPYLQQLPGRGALGGADHGGDPGGGAPRVRRKHAQLRRHVLQSGAGRSAHLLPCRHHTASWLKVARAPRFVRRLVQAPAATDTSKAATKRRQAAMCVLAEKGKGSRRAAGRRRTRPPPSRRPAPPPRAAAPQMDHRAAAGASPPVVQQPPLLSMLPFHDTCCSLL